MSSSNARLFEPQSINALSQANRFSDETAGPSAIQPKGEQLAFYGQTGPYAMPRAMHADDIEAAVAGFVEAADRAIHVAGFDGVEIHGANGYLLDQSLTDDTNARADEWGGDVAARLGLHLRVARAVRDRLGATVPVGIRISQGKVNDLTHRWPEGEAAARIVFEGLAAAGLDFIHVTEYHAWAPAFGDDGASLVALARRYAPAMTLIANGHLEEPERAVQVLDDGADVVAIGRGALANPDWPSKVRAARELDAFDAGLLSPIANIKDCELAPAD